MFESILTTIAKDQYIKLSNDIDICTNDNDTIDQILCYNYSIKNTTAYKEKCTDDLDKKSKLPIKIQEDLIKFSKIYGIPVSDDFCVTTIKDDLYLYKSQNNNIINYTPLEQALYDVCNLFNITYTVVNDSKSVRDCMINLTYEVINKTIDPCVVSILSITDYIQKCGYNINISEEECIFAYNVLKEDQSCNLTLQQYQQLLSLGWTPYSLEMLYSNQYSLSSDGKTLKSSLNYYLVDDIPFCGVTAEGFTNEQDFLELALKDVDIPSTVKNEILNK